VRGERREQRGHARLAQPGAAQLEAAQRASADGAVIIVGGGAQLRGELPRAPFAELVVRRVEREGRQRRVGERGGEAGLEAVGRQLRAREAKLGQRRGGAHKGGEQGGGGAGQLVRADVERGERSLQGRARDERLEQWLQLDLRVREVELHQRVRAAERRCEGHGPLVLADRVVRERQPSQPQPPHALAQQRAERRGAARADGAAVELQ